MTLFKVAVKRAAILDFLLKIQFYRKMRKLKIRFARVVKYHIIKHIAAFGSVLNVFHRKKVTDTLFYSKMA